MVPVARASTASHLSDALPAGAWSSSYCTFSLSRTFRRYAPRGEKVQFNDASPVILCRNITWRWLFGRKCTTAVSSTTTPDTQDSSNSAVTNQRGRFWRLPAEQIENKQIARVRAKLCLRFTRILRQRRCLTSHRRLVDILMDWTFHRREEGFVIQGGNGLVAR